MKPSQEPETTQNQNLGAEDLLTNSELKDLESEQQELDASLENLTTPQQPSDSELDPPIEQISLQEVSEQSIETENQESEFVNENLENEQFLKGNDKKQQPTFQEFQQYLERVSLQISNTQRYNQKFEKYLKEVTIKISKEQQLAQEVKSEKEINVENSTQEEENFNESLLETDSSPTTEVDHEFLEDIKTEQSNLEPQTKPLESKNINANSELNSQETKSNPKDWNQLFKRVREFVVNKIINKIREFFFPQEGDPDELIDEAEMSFFDHLEELRMRIFYALIAIVLCVTACFFVSKQIVELLEVPAQGVKFVQLSVGEYFFVSLKTAGYSGVLLASPFILYQIIQFVLPGLTRRERWFLGPIVLGSGVLFLGGIAFSYIALIPTALQFFISYGADVVESLYSIERYFEFVLLLMFFTGLLFQVPVIQLLLGLLGIVSSDQMLAGWRYVITGSVVVGAVVTPSVDPFTQCLLAGAVLVLYFGGVGFVKLLGR